MRIRRSIGTFLWLLSTGLSGWIVIRAMGTQEPIVSGIGIIGLLFATTGVYFAMDARRDRAFIATVLSFGMWITGEIFLIPSEYNFWTATVTARAEREMDYQRQADGRRSILDSTVKQLAAEAKETPVRSVGQIQADINAGLAKTYGKGAKARTLAGLTNSCLDLTSPSIKFCKEVFDLQKELEIARDRSTKSSLVWDANTRLDVDTSRAHGAHDLAAGFSKLTGLSPEYIAAGLTFITMWVLFYGRAVPGYLGWRQPKTAKTKAAPTTPLVPYVPEVEHKDPASVTPAANDNPTPVTEPTIEEVSKVEAVTPSALEAPELPLPEPEEATAVTSAESEEPAPVTPPRKTKRQKNLEKFGAYRDLSASVPEIHLPITKVDHLQEALDAVLDEGRAGQLLSSAIGTKRVNAVLKRSGVPLISKEKFDKMVRERGAMRGIRVDSLVGRQLRFVDDEKVGKKEKRERLGSNPLDSLTA